jgi:acetyltransferase
MTDKFGAKGLKFFVQKFMPGGQEVIVGAKAEPGLGHMVMFGLGGVNVELFKDVSFEITPVSDSEAKQMLSSIKAYPLLSGFRGAKGVDQEKLSEVIERISQLVTDLPAIQEMDLNPIIAYEDTICVVDARISI